MYYWTMVHSDNKMLVRSPHLQILVVLLSRILLTRAVDTGGINDGGGSAYGNIFSKPNKLSKELGQVDMLKSLNTVCSHPIFALNLGNLGMGWAYGRS